MWKQVNDSHLKIAFGYSMRRRSSSSDTKFVIMFILTRGHPVHTGCKKTRTSWSWFNGAHAFKCHDDFWTCVERVTTVTDEYWLTFQFLPEVMIPGANRKDYGLWEWEWHSPSLLNLYPKKQIWFVLLFILGQKG